MPARPKRREVALGGPATLPNFFRYVDLVADETSRELAGRTLTLLGHVYERSPLQRVNLAPTLGDGCVASTSGGGPPQEAVR